MLGKVTVNSPTKTYLVRGVPIWVKREDLAAMPPAPPFAKIRGLFIKMLDLQNSGVSTVGYMETSVSMAAWGISYFADLLGMKAVIFYPRYKDGFRDEQERQLQKWSKFHAEVIPIESPNRLSINYHRAKKMLLSKYPDAYMLEHGIPLTETIGEVAEQVKILPKEALGGTIVTCVGSGIMLSGVIKGLAQHFPGISHRIYGILVAPKSIEGKSRFITQHSGVMVSGLLNKNKLKLLDYGYQYTQKEQCECPFPCNPYYDRKAYKWMVDNLENLKQPILFWNIGA